MTTLGSQTTSPTLIERVEIHKSCKALETIVNVFNDYCQAAESLSLVQKKLARALKEAAGLKATNDLASNALNAVAQLLEVLAEVDAKFVKIADRECEDASTEVKKWFKKLAKEEKNHDERIAATNARIKQAGQQYERKAKKKDLSAAEEHTRYINLLSVVGPEMSQEKYNHSLFVSQRHTSTIYSVTSNISRTADAEWQRACECVKRFSPLIGRIGECRAYLEGGWTNDSPMALPNQDASSEGIQGSEKEKASVAENEIGERKPNPSPSASSVSGHSGQRTPAPAYSPASSQPSTQAQLQASPYQVSTPSDPPNVNRHTPTSQQRPPPSSFPAPTEKFNADSVRSIESLSSFPAPPAHFPIPSLASTTPGPSPLSQAQLSPGSRGMEEQNPRNVSGYGVQQPRLESSLGIQITQVTNSQQSSSGIELLPVVESPRSLGPDLQSTTPALTEDSDRSPMASQVELSTPKERAPMLDSSKTVVNDKNGRERNQNPEISETNRDGVVSPTTQSPMAKERKTSVSEQINESGQRQQADVRKVGMERTDSIVSTSNVVASMRDKLVRGQYQPSSPPRDRDIPRIVGKVSDLASRYTPVDEPLPSPISSKVTGRNPPIAERANVSPILGPRPNVDLTAEQRQAGLEGEALMSSVSPRNQATLNNADALEEEISARRRRIEQLEELEQREQAHALRLRERELEQRAFEIQRERERLQGYGVRPRINSTTSGAHGTGNLPARPHSQYSYSTTNLPIPRGPETSDIPSRPVSQYGELLPPAHSQASASSSSVSIPRPPSDHAPYCGCYACSAAQYRVQPQTVTEAKPEKPKGWIRRLSMPVGNAFSSDSKNKGPSSKGGGVVSEGLVLNMKPSFEQDATGGISNVRPRKLSFGRR